MSIKQIRLSSQAKDQLVRLKAKTGIAHWNVLCRWAFCVSLSEATPPTPIEVPADSNVEMSWLVFAGEYHELYLALLKERCVQDGQEISDKELNRHFRLHLHRGISYLAAPNVIRSIADLIALVRKLPIPE
jgi:DNA sulfur modification protein DndE